MPVDRGAEPAVAIVLINWRKRAATLEVHRRPESPRVGALNAGAGRLRLCGLQRRRGGSAGAGRSLRAERGQRRFAGGANLGMREAPARGADWLWFVNNDALPAPDALGLAPAAAQARRRGAGGRAKILRRYAPDRLDSVGLEVDLGSGRVQLIGRGEPDRGQYDLLTDPVGDRLRHARQPRRGGAPARLRRSVLRVSRGRRLLSARPRRGAALLLRRAGARAAPSRSRHARPLDVREPLLGDPQPPAPAAAPQPGAPWRHKLQELEVGARAMRLLPPAACDVARRSRGGAARSRRLPPRRLRSAGFRTSRIAKVPGARVVEPRGQRGGALILL